MATVKMTDRVKSDILSALDKADETAADRARQRVVARGLEETFHNLVDWVAQLNAPEEKHPILVPNPKIQQDYVALVSKLNGRLISDVFQAEANGSCSPDIGVFVDLVGPTYGNGLKNFANRQEAFDVPFDTSRTRDALSRAFSLYQGHTRAVVTDNATYRMYVQRQTNWGVGGEAGMVLHTYQSHILVPCPMGLPEIVAHDNAPLWQQPGSYFSSLSGDNWDIDRVMQSRASYGDFRKALYCLDLHITDEQMNAVLGAFNKVVPEILSHDPRKDTLSAEILSVIGDYKSVNKLVKDVPAIFNLLPLHIKERLRREVERSASTKTDIEAEKLEKLRRMATVRNFTS